MSTYETAPTTSAQDTAVVQDQEKSQIGKPTSNAFANNLDFWTQAIGPTVAMTYKQGENPEAASVVSAAINGVASGTSTLNMMTSPYSSYGYGYGGAPAPYAPYMGGVGGSSYPGGATTMRAMTSGGGTTMLNSGTDYSMNPTGTGAGTDLQNQIAQMSESQMAMLSFQMQVSEQAVNIQALSNVLNTKIQTELSEVRNMKVG